MMVDFLGNKLYIGDEIVGVGLYSPELERHRVFELTDNFVIVENLIPFSPDRVVKIRTGLVQRCVDYIKDFDILVRHFASGVRASKGV